VNGGLFRKSTTWGMIFGNMGVIYMVWLYLTWLPAYLEHERHVTIAHTGWLVSVPYLSGTLGMLSSGFVADGLMARGMAPMPRGMAPMRSRKWPICVGLLGATLFTVPAAFTPNLTPCNDLSFRRPCTSSTWRAARAGHWRPSPRLGHMVASLGSIQNFGGYFGGSFAPFITGIVVDKTHSFINAFLISAGIAFAGRGSIYS